MDISVQSRDADTIEVSFKDDTGGSAHLSLAREAAVDFAAGIVKEAQKSKNKTVGVTYSSPTMEIKLTLSTKEVIALSNKILAII